MPGAIAFAYGGSIALGIEKHSLHLENGLTQQLRDPDKQPPMRTALVGFWKTKKVTPNCL